MPSTISRPAVSAPYADHPIQVSLLSTTSLRYRPLNCLECGRTFLERDNAVFYRPDGRTAHVDADGVILALCPHCSQKYVVTVSMHVVYELQRVPLHEINQSIYFVPAETRERRLTRCMECGKAFQTMLDRISQVVDNAMPVEFLEPGRTAPLETICRFNRCGQRWSLVV